MERFELFSTPVVVFEDRNHDAIAAQLLAH
jgi:hypothetical protein